MAEDSNEKPDSLQSLLQDLELFDLKGRPHVVASRFQMVRDQEHLAGNSDDAQHAQLELDAFNFVLKDGLASPMYTGTKNDGSPFAIPDIERFSDLDLKYYHNRMVSTQNAYVKARYAQILWSSRHKNLQYAKAAIDCSIQIVDSLNAKDETETPESDYSLSLVLKNAFHLSKQIKYRNEEIEGSILLAIRGNESSPPHLTNGRFRLLQLALENSKTFPKNALRGLDSLCWKWALIEQNPHQAIDLLRFGEAINQKHGLRDKRWQLAIGAQFEKLLEWAEQSENLVATEFCLSAAEAYKLGGDEKKEKSLTAKYERLKSSQKFGTVSVPIDQDALKQHIRNCEERAKALAALGSDKLLAFLALDDSILPNVSKLKRAAEDQREQFIFQRIIPKVTVDKRGHVAKHAIDDDELEQSSILWNYRFDINFDKKIQIATIVYEGIRSGEVSAETVVKFLKRGWLGAQLDAKVGQSIISYSWIDQIMPAIAHFIREVQMNTMSPTYEPNTVLATDSLVLKFEGIVRDLLTRTNKATTSKPKHDGRKRKVIREKDLSILLNEPGLQDLFSENEILFFKFIFTEHDGWNLRGEIAHCLRYAQEYGANQFSLVFAALLRLSKFTTNGTRTQETSPNQDHVIPQPENLESSTQRKPSSKKAEGKKSASMRGGRLKQDSQNDLVNHESKGTHGVR